ncbi:MAG: restriction endonuclease [bacterium]|nr:restriction endonuclease [bacterium]
MGWKSFEKRTQIALEALGYKVECDVNFNGNQIDLFAKKSDSLITNCLIVECKFYKSKIGVSKVRNFSAIINSSMSSNALVTGLMVSEEGFTKEAKEFAGKVNILLKSLNELLLESFNSNLIIKNVIEKFESDELSTNYIPLTCKVSEYGSGTIYKPVEKFLDQFLSETKRSGAVILGNFGTGKTSLAKHYSYLIAKRNLENKPSNKYCVLPLYINLRDLKNFENFDVSLLNTFNNHYRANASMKGMKNWLANKSTLLILDGFDEMASKMPKYEITTNLTFLFEFIGEFAQIKILITCRTHFFKNQINESLFGDVLRLYIMDWGTEELGDYITKSNPENSSAVIQTIKKTYNLEELSKTPLFLNMISKTIAEIGDKVNKSKLYQIYTDKWILNQDYRSLLSPNEKLEFMKELAFYLFSNSISAINYQSIPDILRDSFKLDNYDLLKKIDSDIRTCTFLIRTEEGDYHFVHKSFLEYFVSLKLSEEIKSNWFENLSTQNLTMEISSFVADYFNDELQFIVDNILENKDASVRANFVLISGYLNYSNTLLESLIQCIESDKETFVKLNAISSLGNLGHSNCIDELLKLSREVDQIAAHALKTVVSFIKDDRVFSYVIDSITKETDFKRLRILVESVSQNPSEQVDEALEYFCKDRFWIENENVVEAFIHATLNRKNISLALFIESIEKENKRNYRILDSCEKAKKELKNTFSGQVIHQAEKNKSRGLNIEDNRKHLKTRFKYLQDVGEIHSSITNMYLA